MWEEFLCHCTRRVCRMSKRSHLRHEMTMLPSMREATIHKWEIEWDLEHLWPLERGRWFLGEPDFLFIPMIPKIFLQFGKCPIGERGQLQLLGGVLSIYGNWRVLRFGATTYVFKHLCKPWDFRHSMSMPQFFEKVPENNIFGSIFEKDLRRALSVWSPSNHIYPNLVRNHEIVYQERFAMLIYAYGNWYVNSLFFERHFDSFLWAWAVRSPPFHAEGNFGEADIYLCHRHRFKATKRVRDFLRIIARWCDGWTILGRRLNWGLAQSAAGPSGHLPFTKRFLWCLGALHFLVDWSVN